MHLLRLQYKFRVRERTEAYGAKVILKRGLEKLGIVLNAVPGVSRKQGKSTRSLWQDS
jgi:hypothetical protein